MIFLLDFVGLHSLYPGCVSDRPNHDVFWGREFHQLHSDRDRCQPPYQTFRIHRGRGHIQRRSPDSSVAVETHTGRRPQLLRRGGLSGSL